MPFFPENQTLTLTGGANFLGGNAPENPEKNNASIKAFLETAVKIVLTRPWYKNFEKKSIDNAFDNTLLKIELLSLYHNNNFSNFQNNHCSKQHLK